MARPSPGRGVSGDGPRPYRPDMPVFLRPIALADDPSLAQPVESRPKPAGGERLLIGVRRGRRPGSPGAGRSSRLELVPIAIALLAAALLVFLDDRFDGVADVGIRFAISITIVLIVVRQTALLAERRVA